MVFSKVVNFSSDSTNDTSVTYDEGQKMLAFIDSFEANVTSYGAEGFTTPDSDNTGFQGYVATLWSIGTFIVTIRIDQSSNTVALLPSLVLPFSGQSDMATVTGSLTNDGDELVENFTLTTTNNTQLVKGKARAYVKNVNNELQIWGHVDAQSNELGNVDADLYFGKVWQSSSDSSTSTTASTHPTHSGSGFCVCTKYNSCGCRMYASGPPGYVCTCFSGS